MKAKKYRVKIELEYLVGERVSDKDEQAFWHKLVFIGPDRLSLGGNINVEEVKREE